MKTEFQNPNEPPAKSMIATNDLGQLAVRGFTTYNQDGLATIHNCDFLKDLHFANAVKLGESIRGWPSPSCNHWRIYVACWAAQQAARLEGDFVECGVDRGGLALAILYYVEFPKLLKTFFLLDTFKGPEVKCGSEKKNPPDQANCCADLQEERYESVKAAFVHYPNVRIVRGSIPEMLPLAQTDKVSFIHINSALPEVIAAEYFWDKLVPGGVMLLEDYGLERPVAEKKALDRFASEKGAQILSLPTGQGLVIKPSVKKSNVLATRLESFYSLATYLTKDGAFDYARYRQIQIEGNKEKLAYSWVREENIDFLARYITKKLGTPTFGICHGTRRGNEQAWFAERLKCKVIGTEISDTASQFPNTIQWDFHEIKPEWVGAADFIYSNSFDHTYDPEKCLNAWMTCVKPGGLCIIEHSSSHGPTDRSLLDPFGADIVLMPYLIANWGKGAYAVREIVPAPIQSKKMAYWCFIMIHKF